MKNKLSTIVLCSVMTVSSFALMGAASAEEVKMIGSVVSIKMAGDGKSADAVLKDVKSGDPVTLTVTDDLTLEKFKDKRIVAGDEIRAKFEKKDGKNKSQIFKKTAGC